MEEKSTRRLAKTFLTKRELSTLTAGVPLARGVEPEEVAGVFLWLDSDKSSYVTGCAYQLDGGILAGFKFAWQITGCL